MALAALVQADGFHAPGLSAQRGTTVATPWP